MNEFLPLFIILPMGAAFFIPLVSIRWRWVPDLLANLIIVILCLQAVLSLNQNGIYQLGGWSPGLGIQLRLDGLSALLLLMINGIAVAAGIFSISFMNRYTSKLRYYSLFLLLLAGLNGIVLTGDLFSLYIFIELVSVASYVLVAFGCDHKGLEASFKYAVQGTVASSLILVAMALAYAMLGTLDLEQMAHAIAQGGINNPLLLALGLFLCGFGLKAAMVPFHTWLPDAYPAAPAPVAALLAGVATKTAGLYVLARLIFNVFSIDSVSVLLPLLRWAGLISMLLGALLMIGQWEMKRLFSYSSISQIGYILLAFGLGTPLGIVGALFHMLNHSVIKSLLFLNAGTVEYAAGHDELKRLGGLNKAMPLAANSSLLASLSIAGIPPFNGFWSKLIIVLACIQSGHPWMALTAVLVSLITLAAFLKVLKYVFHDCAQLRLDRLPTIPVFMRLSLFGLTVLCLLLALLVLPGFSEPWLITPAAKALAPWAAKSFSFSMGI